MHHVNLTTVVRQREPQLIKAINELSTGDISAESDRYLKLLARPLPNEISDPIFIYGTRDEVAVHNLRRIQDLNAASMVYRSRDTGKTSALDKFVNVPQQLLLKEHAKVILQKNLSNELVNGLQGVVEELESDGPIVFFPTLNIRSKLTRTSFSVYGRSNKILAQRHQIPLSLGYAITSHKSQGLTLNNVVVNCTRMKKPGQVGVAVGRVRSSSGLQLKEYANNKDCAPKVSDEITKFYQIKPKDVATDRSCCQVIFKLL